MSQLLAIRVDPGEAFGRQLNELERSQLPFAVSLAINRTAEAVRQGWAAEMPRVFDRPTPLTVRAVLYKKGTKASPAADIFIRDEVFKGTSPAQYLEAQVMGGSRRQTGKERKLAAAGLLPAGFFAVPGRSAPLDAYGNVPLAQVNRILAQLGAQQDPLSNETDVSRRRRQGRERRAKGFTTQYFALTKARGRLGPGVYRRIRLGRLGSAVESILRFVRRVAYRPRYPIRDLAQQIFDRRFPKAFDDALSQAVASAWARELRR